MRSLAALSLPVALAAAARTSYTSAADPREWSYTPDKTADWYKNHGEPLPEPAPAVTSVKEEQSYVVKLECVGCPFRVRSIGEVNEAWQKPAQDNSLLLNFTIDDSNSQEPLLLLNGEVIAPYITLPRPISAFQTPANLTKDTMGLMVDQHMLDASWSLGTKYGQFELQYVHTTQATKDPAEEYLQFDVTGVHRRGLNPGSASLDNENQKLVQLLLHQATSGDAQSLSIKDIQVIERKDRAEPLKMKCGRPAMIQTGYNPLEWDNYGKFGTLSRSWNVFWWFALRQGPLVLVVLAYYFGAQWCIRRFQNREHVEDDAEAALLAPEYAEDAEGKEEKEDEQ